MKPGETLLDIGSGWGALACHAARNYGVDVVGVTLSEPQIAYSRERAERLGLRGKVTFEFQDYALISRIQDSETGHVVLAIGGLYTYGTLAAGEFLTDPELMKATATEIQRAGNRNLQIVLGTTVTDDTPGPPRVLAVSTE